MEPLTFEEALAAEPERLAGERERMAADPSYYSRAHDYYTYRDRGIYLPQIKRWMEIFPSENILIMLAEDLYKSPQLAFDRVVEFLGLPPSQLLVAERHNYLPAPQMNPLTREELTEFYRPHNRDLFDSMGVDFGWEC
ncbi:sulfotransferase domain-containing protein [Streptosporangium lutulentum]